MSKNDLDVLYHFLKKEVVGLHTRYQKILNNSWRNISNEDFGIAFKQNISKFYPVDNLTVVFKNDIVNKRPIFIVFRNDKDIKYTIDIEFETVSKEIMKW